MSELAFACYVLEIPVDPARLYDNEDPYFVRWLSGVADRLANRRREEQAKVKKK